LLASCNLKVRQHEYAREPKAKIQEAGTIAGVTVTAFARSKY
jgi:hypothetical protein